MKHDNGSTIGYFTIGIAALFLAGFLMLVVIGAQSYRNTVEGQDRNSTSRALLSYISACVRSNDTENAVSVEESERGQVLVVNDLDTGYAFRIYWQNGKLLEEYTTAGAELEPASARVIGQTETFSVERLPNDILSIRTDAGRVLLHTRCEEVGA